MSFFDTSRTGPMVIDFPAGELAGGVGDFWQRNLIDMGETGPDRGRGQISHSRSGSEGAGGFLIAGPKWHGNKPPGIRKVFQAETEIVGTLTRTALTGPEDVPNVRTIQAQYKLQPLSAFLGKPAPTPAPSIDFLPYDREKAQGHDFIAGPSQATINGQWQLPPLQTR